MKVKPLLSVSLLSMLCLVFLCSVLSCPAFAQMIDIGDASGNPGGAVSVPVTLTAPSNMTAAFMRVSYNATVLENPSAAAGALASSGHALDFNSPAPGQLNVIVCSSSGAPAFTAQSGVLFYLQVDIKRGAAPGDYSLTYTTAGAPAIPTTNLVNTAGALVAHSTSPGKVTVNRFANANASWMLYE